MRVLTEREVAELLTPQQLSPVNNAPIQTSNFVRWFDREMRCANRGCNSPTYLKVKGVPRCMMHAIRQLMELCDEMYDQLKSDGLLPPKPLKPAQPSYLLGSEVVVTGEL